nr:2OG-Fe(II) oxygenase [Nitrospirota bacterium]
MIQLTRSSTICTHSPSELDDLRQLFDRQHCVRLPQLLEPSLLQFIQRQIEQTAFDEFIDVNAETGQPWGCEWRLRRGTTWGLLHLLANDPRLFQIIRQITGCAPIGCFSGRVYRVVPGHNHYDSWHDDCSDHRMIAMSINLSTEIYSGGVLQLRNVSSGEVIHEVANTGFGDAIIFRIDESLEHRLTDVAGTSAKTAFPGWFCSQPNFSDLLPKK